MCRLRGRSLRGARLKANTPLGKWGTQTFIAGLRCGERSDFEFRADDSIGRGL